MKTKETNPTRPGSPTPCKQAPSPSFQSCLTSGLRIPELFCFKDPPSTESSLFAVTETPEKTFLKKLMNISKLIHNQPALYSEVS